MSETQKRRLKFYPFAILFGVGCGVAFSLYGLSREALLFALIYFVSGALSRGLFDLLAWTVKRWRSTR